MSAVIESPRGVDEGPSLKNLPAGFDGLKVGIVDKSSAMCQSCAKSTSVSSK